MNRGIKEKYKETIYTGLGLALLKLKDCKTLNMLPSLLVPVLWFLVKSLMDTLA